MWLCVGRRCCLSSHFCPLTVCANACLSVKTVFESILLAIAFFMLFLIALRKTIFLFSIPYFFIFFSPFNFSFPPSHLLMISNDFSRKGISTRRITLFTIFKLCNSLTKKSVLRLFRIGNNWLEKTAVYTKTLNYNLNKHYTWFHWGTFNRKLIRKHIELARIHERTQIFIFASESEEWFLAKAYTWFNSNSRFPKQLLSIRKSVRVFTKVPSQFSGKKSLIRSSLGSHRSIVLDRCLWRPQLSTATLRDSIRERVLLELSCACEIALRE